MEGNSSINNGDKSIIFGFREKISEIIDLISENRDIWKSYLFTVADTW